MSHFKGAYTVWYDMNMDVQGVLKGDNGRMEGKDGEIMTSSTNLWPKGLTCLMVDLKLT